MPVRLFFNPIFLSNVVCISSINWVFSNFGISNCRILRNIFYLQPTTLGKIPVGMFILVSTIIFIGQALVDKDNWYFVTKIVLTYCEKKMFWWSKKKIKFEAEGREFAKNFQTTRTISSTIGKKLLGFRNMQKKLELVFCYQNCSELLWEKNVLVIEKNFWNSRPIYNNLEQL